MNQDTQFYAGIGSRKTPPEVLGLMTALAYKLAKGGHVLRSGGAQGADQAFENGCDQAEGGKQIYIPWTGFQNRYVSMDPYVIVGGNCPRALELAAEIHPNWGACSSTARALHARNCFQILGPNLDDPVSDVLCWTPEGHGGGGTGQAIRLANKMLIPVWDLGKPVVRKHFERMLDRPD